MPTLLALQAHADIYPAPAILDDDVERKVFSHKSLFSLPAHVQMRSEEPEDWERLAFLGDQILSMCTTDVIFERYPLARTNFLTNRRSLVVSNDQVAKWSQAYGFHDRIQAQSSQIQVLRSSMTAQASVFEAYVGAVYTSEGFDRASRWLKPLIQSVLDEADQKLREDAAEEGDEDEDEDRPEEDVSWNQDPPLEFFAGVRQATITLVEEDDDLCGFPRVETAESTPFSQQSLLRPDSSTPKARSRGRPLAPSLSPQGILDNPFYNAGEPARKASNISNPSALKLRPTGGPSTVAPTTTPSATTPLPTNYSPSPRPTAPPTTSSPFPAVAPTTGNGFLALFNQLAAQKHIEPVWTTGSSGPPHKPTFDAKVTVGNKSGFGRAHNKQAARQIAARDALKNLKWHLE